MTLIITFDAFCAGFGTSTCVRMYVRTHEKCLDRPASEQLASTAAAAAAVAAHGAPVQASFIS